MERAKGSLPYTSRDADFITDAYHRHNGVQTVEEKGAPKGTPRRSYVVRIRKGAEQDKGLIDQDAVALQLRSAADAVLDDDFATAFRLAGEAFARLGERATWTRDAE